MSKQRPTRARRPQAKRKKKSAAAMWLSLGAVLAVSAVIIVACNSSSPQNTPAVESAENKGKNKSEEQPPEIAIKKSQSEEEKYKSLLTLIPKNFTTVGKQAKHPLGGMKTTREEKASYPFNLGPTGILAQRDPKAQTYKVVSVAAGSPAEKKVKKGDIISGANGRKFSAISIPAISKARTPNVQMGLLIEESEKQHEGKITLHIRRGTSDLKVPVQLAKLGGYSNNFPDSCSKMEFLALLDARLLASQQLPDGSFPNGFKSKTHGTVTPIAGLALMATGNADFTPHIHKCAKYLLDHASKGFVSWNESYRAIFLSEYYLRHKDPKAKTAVQEIMNKMCANPFYYNGMYGYGHGYNGGNYRYGGINVCTTHAAMGIAMALRIGCKIPNKMDKHILTTIERLGPDGAIGYAWGASKKDTYPKLKHNENSGRTGIGSMAYRILGGRSDHFKKMIGYQLYNSEFTDCGHSSGGSISWLWGALSMGLDSPETMRKFMKSRIWYFNFNRQWNHSYYLQPSAHLQFRPSDSVLGPNYVLSANIMLGHWNKHSMLITGKKELLPALDRIVDKPIAATPYFLRQDRIVSCARVHSLLGKNCPASVKAYQQALQKLDIDSSAYEQQLAKLKPQMQKALQDIHRCSANELSKFAAADAILGLNIDFGKTKFARGKFNFSLYCLQAPLTCAVEASSTSISGQNISFPLTGGIERKKLKYSRSFKFKSSPGPSLALKIKLKVAGLSFTKSIKLQVEDTQHGDKWTAFANQTIFGTYQAELVHASSNGRLLARLPGNTLIEVGLMGSCRITIQGKERLWSEWLKKKQGLIPGSRIRFSYFNRGRNSILPMANKIEVID